MKSASGTPQSYYKLLFFSQLDNYKAICSIRWALKRSHIVSTKWQIFIHMGPEFTLKGHHSFGPQPSDSKSYSVQPERANPCLNESRPENHSSKDRSRRIGDQVRRT